MVLLYRGLDSQEQAKALRVGSDDLAPDHSLFGTNSTCLAQTFEVSALFASPRSRGYVFSVVAEYRLTAFCALGSPLPFLRRYRFSAKGAPSSPARRGENPCIPNNQALKARLTVAFRRQAPHT